MKFIKLESRGGNYLVVASNVAWLRVAENGQTSVGIVGGQPLLVVGSPEEVAAKLLDAAGHEPDTAPAAPVAAPAPKPSLSPSLTGEQPNPAIRKGTSLSERIAAAAAPKVKSGSQRLMGVRE